MLKRNERVVFRVDTAELFRLHRMAQMSGSTVAAFVRKCCFDDERIVIINQKAVSKIYEEMNAIGRNVNQIARIANSNHHIHQQDIDNLLRFQKELAALVDQNFGGMKGGG
ncbi:MAG: plasmid mobilization protein [Christensenellaceae bacterium]